MPSAPPSTRLRAVIVDDHEMVRAGLRTMLERFGDCEIVAEASDGRAAIELASQLSPDLVILEVLLPLVDGIEATRQIRAHNSKTRVIICSVHHKQEQIEGALRAGASAYLLKSSAGSELALAIKAVNAGHIYLSPKAAKTVVDAFICQSASASRPAAALSARDRAVLQLVAEGKNNRQISACLGLSTRTVESHRMQLIAKLSLRTVAELTKYAIREGLTTLEAGSESDDDAAPVAVAAPVSVSARGKD